MKTRLFVLIAVFAIWCGAGLCRAAGDENPRGDAARGKELIVVDGCVQCHGTEGQGAGDFGPKLAPNPLPFEALLAQLRTPAQRMPVYTAKVLSDAAAADIYAYLQSIPAGPPLSDIPMLNRLGVAAGNHGDK